MAKGDLVVGLYDGIGGSYQPAAGVEVVIFTLGPVGLNEGWCYRNAAGDIAYVVPPSIAYLAVRYMRVPINNTNYLFYDYSATDGSSYGGIQTK